MRQKCQLFDTILYTSSMGRCHAWTHLYSWWWRGRGSLPGFDELDAWRHSWRGPCVVWDRWRLWVMTLCRARMPTFLHNSSTWLP